MIVFFSLDTLTLHKLFDFELQLLIIYMRVISEVQLEQKSVPTAVFGGLKDDWICCSFTDYHITSRFSYQKTI